MAECRILIHWDLCNKWKLDHAEKQYDCKPPTVTENEDVKILWDMKIHVYHVIVHPKPDIVVHRK